MSRFASDDADAYESLLEHKAQDCNSSGLQYITPRAHQAMMGRIAPGPGMTVCDPVRGWEEPARDPEVESVAIDAATFELNAVIKNVSMALDARIRQEIIDCVAAEGAVVGRAMARIRGMMIGASQVLATRWRAGAGGLSG